MIVISAMKQFDPFETGADNDLFGPLSAPVFVQFQELSGGHRIDGPRVAEVIK